MRALAGLVVVSLVGCNWQAAEDAALAHWDAGSVEVRDAGSMVDAGVDGGRVLGRVDQPFGPDAGRALFVGFDGTASWALTTLSASSYRLSRDGVTVMTNPSATAYNLYTNPDVQTGVVVLSSTGTTTSRLELYAGDGRNLGIQPLNFPAEFATLFNEPSNGASVSVWSDFASKYTQLVYRASADLPPYTPQLESASCNMAIADVEVLDNGSAALTYVADMGCIVATGTSPTVAAGLLNQGVQLISSTGMRTGQPYYPPNQPFPNGRPVVGRTRNGFDLAWFDDFARSVVTSHRTVNGMLMGGDDRIEATISLEFGDAMYGFVSGVALGTLTRSGVDGGTLFAKRTAFLAPLDRTQPLVELGEAATPTMGDTPRIPLWAGPHDVLVLWDKADAGVVLTHITY